MWLRLANNSQNHTYKQSVALVSVYHRVEPQTRKCFLEHETRIEPPTLHRNQWAHVISFISIGVCIIYGSKRFKSFSDNELQCFFEVK